MMLTHQNPVLVVVAVLLASSTTSSSLAQAKSQAGCLPYEPAVVSLSGTCPAKRLE